MTDRLDLRPTAPTTRRALLKTGAMAGALAPFVGAVVPFLGATARAQTADALVAAAKKEGAGTVYSVQDPAISKMFFDAFTKKYGIPIEVQRLNSGPLSQRFAQEAESGNVLADVLATGDEIFVDTATKKGWFAKIDALPALATFPKELWNGSAAPMSYNPAGLVYNTTVLKSPPKGWEALIDPQWAGRVMVTDPRNSLPVAEWFYLMRQTYGDTFLTTIAKNATFTESTVTSAQQVAAGAMAIATTLHQIVTPLQAKGAPVADIYPEPTALQRTYAAVSAKAPHPNVGRLVLDYYISAEGQALLNNDNWSPLPNVPGTRPMPRVVRSELPKVQAALPEMAKLLGLA